jgi:DnaJ-class molecular chaperone
MTSQEDYYSILGLQKGATDEEITKAYRTLSKIHHPDKNLDNKEKAEEIFKKINEAKNTLLDPEKRRLYDQYGEEGLKGGSSGMGEDFFNNIFSGMFGGFNFPFNRQEEKRKHQQVIKINLSLEDVYNGYNSVKKFNIQKNCDECNSTGKSEVVKCEECGGSGYITMLKNIGPGIISQNRTGCNKCNMKGKVGRGNNCKECEGKGNVNKQITIEIKFPKCVEDNQVYKVEKEGIEFIFVSKIENHTMFQREGNNLVLIKEISLFSALNKVEFEVEMLDKKKIRIESKDNDVIVPSKPYFIPNYGLNKEGSLKIFFKVNYPEKINKDGNNIYQIFREEKKEEKKEDIETFYL